MMVVGFDHDKEKCINYWIIKYFLGKSWGDQGNDKISIDSITPPEYERILSRVVYPILSYEYLLLANRVYDNFFWLNLLC